LRADLHGDRLTLVADGQLAWDGSVGALVTEFDGPVSLRTDNARFDLEYLTVLSDPAPPKRLPNCAVSPGG
jgi:hypothetical protein